MTDKSAISKKRLEEAKPFFGGNGLMVGARAELIVCADLLARGYSAYRSESRTGIDLVALVGDDLTPLKIEVRSGKKSNNGSVSYAAIPKHQQRYDVLAVAIPTGEVYYYGPLANLIYSVN